MSGTSHRRAELSVALEETTDPIARRELLKLMGAAIGLAGLSACTRAPSQEIVPYVVQPREVTPGRPRFYATATTLDGYATGVLVESHEGRPTKVEGNPAHPASLGASSVFDQASVLGLYDPSRARAIKERGAVITAAALSAALTKGAWTERSGRGLHFLLEPTSSPTIAELLAAIRRRWPAADVHFHSVAPRANVWEGARLAFGRFLEPRIDLSRADVIVALDSDFLACGPAHLALARQFAERRRLRTPQDGMSRLYVAEALYSPTGASADHRLAVRAHDVVALAAALLAEVGGGAALPNLAVLRAAASGHARWLAAVGRDLALHRGRSIVIVGDGQPPIVHALAHALNATLGNLGATLQMAPSPILEVGAPSHELAPLEDALIAGDVDTLVIVGSNVAYTSPADRRLRELIGRARQSAYLGLYEDETARVCTFSVPEAHPLESWGDARAFDGTTSIVQPLIAPLVETSRSAIDVLALYAGRAEASGYSLVREQLLRDRKGTSAELEAQWRRALTRGVVDDTAIAPVATSVTWAALSDALARAAPPPATGTLELVLPLDPRVHDGRFGNNAWLLELPAPITTLTWTNAATLGPELAAKVGVTNGDELELHVQGRTVRAPALVVAGQCEDTVGLSLGWGRSGAEELARDAGSNAYVLRTSQAATMAAGITLRKTGVTDELPITQAHRRLEGRDEDIVQHETLAEYTKQPRPRSRQARQKRPLELYGSRPRQAPHQWGMAIDLSICTGCSSCVVACQAENNVPTVGREGVLKGRAMHWLRIDTYVLGDRANPDVALQPMLCQHCEKAPCEYVCPTNATVHSPDGLNEMVYNRCVGTRFCSNNCPYKVRRFNWFDFHRGESATEQLVHNPDVTVRERGVMEKCTFCVQRLREYEIRSEVEAVAKKAPPKPPQTACQQSCPTGAIVFGDLQDRGSDVARLHESERAYGALNNLGTNPRVRYLARIRNQNPELA